LGKVATIALSAVFAVAFGLACGGRTAALGGDRAGAQGDESGSGSSSGPSSSGTTSTSGSGGSGGSSGGSSSGDDVDATFPEDVSIPPPPGCGPDVQTFGASSPSLASCWGCVEKGCGMQLYGCSHECSCNSAIVDALECATNDGKDVVSCFAPALSGDSVTNAVANCLASAGNECGCLSTPPTEDASSGCVTSGGGSSGSAGECTSDLSETCGGTMYKVVCSCPQAQCVCFGDTTTIIAFDGCPLCPGILPGTSSESALFASCGFPQ
jgi:hypothetical protein